MAKYIRYNEVSLYRGSFTWARKIVRYTEIVIWMLVKSRFYCTSPGVQETDQALSDEILKCSPRFETCDQPLFINVPGILVSLCSPNCLSIANYRI